LLPKVFRLKNKAEFQKAYQQGKSVTSPSLVLTYYRRETSGQPKIGFAAARKLGTAVMRNRIKRQMREAVRPHLHKIDPNYNIIFLARMKIKGISVVDMEKNMSGLLQRARLINRDDK